MENRSDIEISSIDRALNKEHFYAKISERYAPQTSPRPFFNFGKQPKTASVCKKLLKDDYRKTFKKLT